MRVFGFLADLWWWRYRDAVLLYANACATEEKCRAVARGGRSVSFWRGHDAGFAGRARVTSGYNETDAAVTQPQLFLGLCQNPLKVSGP